MQDLRIRFTIIILVILAACYLLWPTYKFYSLSNEQTSSYQQDELDKLKDNAIKLGLDLQGGMYIVLEADVPTLMIKSANKMSQELKSMINSAATNNSMDFFVEFKRLVNSSDIRLVRYYTDLTAFRDNEAIINELINQRDNAISSVVEIIRNRIDEFGVSEPTIQKYGKNRIIVELAGVTDADRARSLIQKTASMEFLLVINDRLPEILEQIDNSLIKSNYEIPSLPNNDINITSTNNVDDIFSNTNDDELNFANYQTPKDILQEQPFSGYIQMYGYSLGVAVNEVGIVRDILNREDIKKLTSRDGKFIWGNRIEKAQSQNNIPFDYIPIYYVKSKPVISGGMIKNPTATIGSAGSSSSGQWVVNLDMNSDGTRKWSRFTGANKNKQVAISLDNKVYMAPVIRDKIPSGSTQISGFADANEAKDIANVLQAGELPTPVNIIQERTIGPSLGRDSIQLGRQAMVLGMVLVMFFMIIYYRGSGLLAAFAMFLNLLIVMAVLVMLGASLTLPGIAGLILTIGMAVDANVIVFERIREELNLGKTPMSAIRSGYDRAFITILDANFTTLIAAFVLAWIGSGPIRGFAITLSVGILCSMFTAVFVTKTIFTFISGMNAIKKVSI